MWSWCIGSSRGSIGRWRSIGNRSIVGMMEGKVSAAVKGGRLDRALIEHLSIE
jgi:hypothetical protein